MVSTKPEAIQVNDATLDQWATDSKGPVALHLKQRLLPVESLDGDGGIIYPPTYADIGYNIDALSDGTKVALIDSVGSQANRMEPVFKAAPEGQPDNPLAKLVPQIEIVINHNHGKANDAEAFQEKVSLLDIAHRSADATVMSSPTIAKCLAQAFGELRRNGDCSHLCALAPTSLVFGVWDSRGNSNEKLPRLVRSVIRAWDVEELHAAAQYNSVWKLLDEGQRNELEKEAKAKKKKLSEYGLKDAPATFRKTSQRSGIPDFRDGSPNLEKRVLGGVHVRDRIEREATVNLVALRHLRGANPKKTKLIQKYLLGLSLLAATTDMDLFLREGCHLRYTGEDVWHEIPRRGEPRLTNLASPESRKIVEEYTNKAFQSFRSLFEALTPDELEHVFDIKAARKLLVKKTGDEDNEG